MNKHDEVIDFLKSTCKSMYVGVDEAYQLVTNYPGNKPAPIKAYLNASGDKKALPIFLPAQEVIKSSRVGKEIIYFPFAESIFKGNSEMLNFTLRSLNVRLHGTMTELTKALIQTAMDKDDQSYGNEVTKVLKGLDIKKTLGKKVIQFLKSATKHNPVKPGSFLSIKLSRDVPSGVSYIRSAKLTTVNPDASKIFGEEPVPQIRDLLEKIIENIFGDKETREKEYGVVSNSKMCPSYFCVLKCFAVIADRLNELSQDLGKYKDENLFINDEWFDKLSDEAALEKYHSRVIINKFEGNVGLDKNTAPAVEQKVENTNMARPKRNFDKPQVNQAQPEVIQQTSTTQQEVTQEQPVQNSGGGILGILAGGTKKFEGSDEVQAQTSGAVSTVYRNPVAMSNGGFTQPQQQQQQNFSQTGMTSNQAMSPGYEIIRPTETMQKRRQHMRDMNGQLLYWHNGAPYEANASSDVFDGMVWEQDMQGNFLYIEGGEPSLVKANGGNFGPGGFQPNRQNGNQNNGSFNGWGQTNTNNFSTGNVNLPTPQQIAQMSFPEQLYWKGQYEKLRASQQNSGNWGGGNQNSNNMGWGNQNTSNNLGWGGSGVNGSDPFNL